MSGYGHSRFANELNAMLDEISMSAEDIIIELNKRSFPIPLHTFKNWLHGYFLPRSDAAFQLITILENIGGITDNRLSNALLYDLSSGASFIPGPAVQEELLGTVVPADTRFYTTADEEIDWEANLIQKVVRDTVVVSSDYTHATYNVTILARIPSVPNPTFNFQLLLEKGVTNDGPDYFYNVSGMELKNQKVFEENGMTVYAARFALPDDVIPGNLHKLSYSWKEKSDKPMQRIGERLLPWTLDFYSCTLTFEDGIPEGVRYVTLDLTGDREKKVPNDIPVIQNNNTLSVSMKKFGNIDCYFEIPAPREN